MGVPTEKRKWEEVTGDPWTHRLPVPGGWLYCVTALSEGGQQYTYALTFVPDSRCANAD